MRNSNCLKFILILLFPLNVSAQDITGLWKGTMYNDTTQKTLKYEIAISQNGKKLSGYCHTYFVIDDREYHGIKKVKIRQQDGKIIIEDDGLVANNYPVSPPKGVRQLNILTLSITDSLMILSGPFTTNRTKEYRSLTGSISVQRKNNYSQSALIPHLQELNLTQNLSFLQPEKDVALNEIDNKKVDVVKNESTKKVKNTALQNSTKPNVTPNALPVVMPVNTAPAADLSKREIIIIQTVNYKSDSLELILYDNGEVDGDTVSVVMNGQVVMGKVGLSTNAVRKKISTKNTGDSIQLIMYAETLGSLPPNTGLLIVNDGADRYEIRFSGDMQKSGAIVFRKKE
jgi:hypothetical protein